MNATKTFTRWAESHSELTRAQIGALIGTDARTVRRYLSGDTIPHGGVMRLLEAFRLNGVHKNDYNDGWTAIERTMIERHT